MTRVYKKRERNKLYTEQDLQKAVDLVIKDNYKVSDVVKHFKGFIPDQTIRDRVTRVKKNMPQIGQRGPQTTLPYPVEEHLAGFLGYLSELGHPQVKCLS